MAKNNKQGGDRSAWLLLCMVIKLVYQPYGDRCWDLTGLLPRVSPWLSHVSYHNDFEVYTCQHDLRCNFGSTQNVILQKVAYICYYLVVAKSRMSTPPFSISWQRNNIVQIIRLLPVKSFFK